MKKAFSVILIDLLLFSGLPLTALPASAADKISRVDVYGVTAPVAGAKPSYTAYVLPDAEYQVEDYDSATYRNGIYWHNSTDKKAMIPDTDTFEAGTKYMIHVSVLSADYVAEFSEYFTATLNGMDAVAEWYSEFDAAVEYTFTCPYPTSGTTGDCTWNYNEETRTLTISGNGKMADYGSSDVPWKNYRGKIKNVVINNGVTYIGNCAFFYVNNGFTSVTIPDSVETIGSSAFQHCSDLTTVKLSKNLKSIGPGAFRETALTSVILPDSVEEIGKRAFDTCKKLVYAQLGKNLKTIGEYAFYGSAITSIPIPDGVTNIPLCAFDFCINLVHAEIGKNVKIIGESAFCDTALTEITIPDSVETISDSAFQGTALTEITIPDSVETIEQYAFENCEALASVQLGNGVKTVGKRAFTRTALTEVTIPGSVGYIGENAFGYTYNDSDYYNTYKVSGFTVKGVKGSSAEMYAKENHFMFVEIANALLGDADTDGDVTILDATAIQRTLAELPTQAYDAKAADADEDGEVTILDATAIQRHLADLLTNPHIGQPM